MAELGSCGISRCSIHGTISEVMGRKTGGMTCEVKKGNEQKGG